ncbi:hypothetical protein [Bacillus sp. AK128]
MYVEDFESVKKTVTLDEMSEMADDLWNLFKNDYSQNDESMFSQITYRVIYELEAWTDGDAQKYAAVCRKLMDLNLRENKSREQKEILAWLESQSEMASALEWLEEIAITREDH